MSAATSSVVTIEHREQQLLEEDINDVLEAPKLLPGFRPGLRKLFQTTSS